MLSYIKRRYLLNLLFLKNVNIYFVSEYAYLVLKSTLIDMYKVHQPTYFTNQTTKHNFVSS